MALFFFLKWGLCVCVCVHGCRHVHTGGLLSGIFLSLSLPTFLKENFTETASSWFVRLDLPTSPRGWPISPIQHIDVVKGIAVAYSLGSGRMLGAFWNLGSAHRQWGLWTIPELYCEVLSTWVSSLVMERSPPFLPYGAMKDGICSREVGIAFIIIVLLQSPWWFLPGVNSLL